MGMTFFFESDDQTVDIFDCNRCSCMGEVHPECPECKGKGKVEFPRGENEFHFSYSSSYHLFHNIGHEFDDQTYSGALRWQDMEDYMDRLVRAMIQQDYPVERGMVVLKALRNAWSKKSDICFG